MDRPLDDTISERRGPSNRARGSYGGRRADFRGRNDQKKWNHHGDPSDIDNDWVHDKYEDDPLNRPRHGDSARHERVDRYSSDREYRDRPKDARLRVDNLHYELTQDDLEDLFNRIAPVTSVNLKFDRAGRSTGTAFVSYASLDAANQAVREFDGANAAGQPIRLTLLPTGPGTDYRPNGATSNSRNPFDTVTRQGRSLFERIDNPDSRRRGGRSRSRSPSAPRRANVLKPPPEGVDRYVPYERHHRRRSSTRSPPRRRRSPLRRGRGGPRRDGEGDTLVGGRPKKTQEELDKEMEEYWGSKEVSNGPSAGNVNKVEQADGRNTGQDEDVDMIT